MRPYLFIIIIILTACSKEVELPEEVYTQEQMIELMLEFHLLEAKVENLYVHEDSSRMIYRHFEPLVFEKYKADSTTYWKSLDYYMDHPKLLHGVYEAVVDSLLVREKNRDHVIN